MRHLPFTTLACLVLATACARAITPMELEARLKSGAPLTVIDLRPTVLYERSHIPGAISIPSDTIADRQLPPVGNVVAYCDGLGATYAADCVAALNKKPGITAEALDGGFAAWRTCTNNTAGAGSVQPQAEMPAITYEQLEKTGGTAVTLVDVRRPAAGGAFNLQPFCQTCVPRAQMTTQPMEQLKRWRGGATKFQSAPSLLVVIGSDDTTAADQARRIRAAGYERVVVLTGGEEIIKRKGVAGLARGSTAASIIVEPKLKPVPVPTPAPAAK